MPGGWWRGEVLKEIREKRGMTQGQLARKVRVHLVTISRIETGARNPSMALLHKLAKALKVNAGQLLK